MKAHDLARVLLVGPDVRVVINGWGSDEGFTFEVTKPSPLGTCSFSAVHDSKRTPRTVLGYPKARPCICLEHCRSTPTAEKDIRREAAERRKARALKRRNPRAYALQFAEIKPLTPTDLIKLCQTKISPLKS